MGIHRPAIALLLALACIHAGSPTVMPKHANTLYKKTIGLRVRWDFVLFISALPLETHENAR